VIHGALGRPVPVELTSDPRIRARVARLAVVSVVALALVLSLAIATLDTWPMVVVALALGWATMPTILAWSYRRPGARYLLVVPASLVSLALVAVCLVTPVASVPAAIGWAAMTSGVLLGGLLGIWFWYRLLPVPRALDDPLGRGRWELIALHVALVVVGGVLAATRLFT
jgi:hypothetical protein